MGGLSHAHMIETECGVTDASHRKCVYCLLRKTQWLQDKLLRNKWGKPASTHCTSRASVLLKHGDVVGHHMIGGAFDDWGGI